MIAGNRNGRGGNEPQRCSLQNSKRVPISSVRVAYEEQLLPQIDAIGNTSKIPDWRRLQGPGRKPSRVKYGSEDGQRKQQRNESRLPSHTLPIGNQDDR